MLLSPFPKRRRRSCRYQTRLPWASFVDATVWHPRWVGSSSGTRAPAPGEEASGATAEPRGFDPGSALRCPARWPGWGERETKVPRAWANAAWHGQPPSCRVPDSLQVGAARSAGLPWSRSSPTCLHRRKATRLWTGVHRARRARQQTAFGPMHSCGRCQDALHVVVQIRGNRRRISHRPVGTWRGPRVSHDGGGGHWS